MGQPKKLSPDVLKLSGRYPAGVLEDPEPIAQRFAHSADLWQASARLEEQSPASKPGATAPLAAAREPRAWTRGKLALQPRLLITGLSLATLVPCLIIGAIWLRASDGTETVPAAAAPEARGAAPMAVLTASDRIEAAAGGQVNFPIALDGTDGVPSRSVIAIKGLPAGSNFSEGRPFGESEWTLRPDQIGDLRLVLPAGASGEFKLGIALITRGVEVISETTTLLAIAPAPVPVVPPAPEPSSVFSPTVSEPAAAAALPDGSEAAGSSAAPDAASGESAEFEAAEAPATTAETPSEIVEQSSEKGRAPGGAQPSTVGQPATNDSGLGTVEPSVFVNLREAPSSSATVLSVVAKGATLPVLDRKRGWVQVTDPATGKQGWIYSGLLVGETKAPSRRKRAPPADAKHETDSESFWGRMGRWLTPG